MNDNHVLIIAEMSANLCGDFELAKKIIAAAKVTESEGRGIILLTCED